MCMNMNDLFPFCGILEMASETEVVDVNSNIVRFNTKGEAVVASETGDGDTSDAETDIVSVFVEVWDGNFCDFFI